MCPQVREAAFRWGWTIDHDVDLMRRVLGEPRLIDDCIVYVHDDEGYVCGWPLRSDGRPRPYLGRNAIHFADRHSLRRLHFWAPVVQDLDQGQRDWRRLYFRPPRAEDSLMRIVVGRFDRAGMRRARNYRRGRNTTRYRIEVVGGTGPIDEIGALLDAYAQRDIASLQVRIMRLAREAELLKEATCLCAWEGSELAGIMILRRPFDHVATMSWSLFNPKMKHVSDALYFHSLRWLLAAGVEEVDFGYGATPSLFAYKSAWGMNDIRGPALRWGIERRT